MKVFLFWPYTFKIEPSTPESYEFYNTLKTLDNVTLVNSFEEADFVIFMMHLHNHTLICKYDTDIDQKALDELLNHTAHEKDIVIDYNDWTDLRNVNEEKLQKVAYYFKRSVVRKNNGWSTDAVQYPREILPISYGIRSDFIEYNKQYHFTQYTYDVCCMFQGSDGGVRGRIPSIVNKYKGPKYVGRVDCPNRYGAVNTKYFDILKTSKIIVTANPPNWEGDFRLWEALVMGNLVLCDKMLVPSLMQYPLIDKKHLVYYSNLDELETLIDYYIRNDTERKKIGKEGQEYCLNHHKFSDRVKEVIEVIQKKAI